MVSQWAVSYTHLIEPCHRHPIQDGRPMEGNCRRTSEGFRTHEPRQYNRIRPVSYTHLKNLSKPITAQKNLIVTKLR